GERDAAHGLRGDGDRGGAVVGRRGDRDRDVVVVAGVDQVGLERGGVVLQVGAGELERDRGTGGGCQLVGDRAEDGRVVRGIGDHVDRLRLGGAAAVRRLGGDGQRGRGGGAAGALQGNDRVGGVLNDARVGDDDRGVRLVAAVGRHGRDPLQGVE